MQTILLLLIVAIGIGGFFGYFSRVVWGWLLDAYRRAFFKPQLLKLYHPPTVKAVNDSTLDSLDNANKNPTTDRLKSIER